MNHILPQRPAFVERPYLSLSLRRVGIPVGISDHLDAVLPPGVELSSFTYRKGRTVSLRGESANVTPIYDYIEALEQSPLFIEVKPEGVTQAPGGRRNPEFRLTARMPGDAGTGYAAP